MAKSVLAVGLLATMVGVWYWALLPPPGQPVPSRPAAPSAARVRPLTAVPKVHLPDLDAAVAPRPSPAAARNPFASAVRFQGGEDADRRASVVAPAASLPAAGPAVPVWPRLDLIGVAEAREGGSLVRTAIVSGPQGVHHVRSGDVVEQVYRVERIGGDGVDVRLMPEDRTLRLALRP